MEEVLPGDDGSGVACLSGCCRRTERAMATGSSSRSSIDSARGQAGIRSYVRQATPAGRPQLSIWISTRREICLDVPLQFAISFAYNVPFTTYSGRLTGGPDWIRSQDYDIEATGVFPDGLSDEARLDRERLMLQALLAERFKLVIHREVKELPVYALVVAKGGPKLQKADIEEKDCPDPSTTPASDPKTLCHTFNGGIGRGIHARAVSISEFANDIENWTGSPARR